MSRTLPEHEAKQLLRDAGIAVAPEQVVTTVEDAVAAAASIASSTAGGAVVLKLSGEGIAHKTERGLVRLALVGPDAVRTAAEELLASARPDDGDVSLLVAPMLRGDRELIAGVVRDEQFGPCVMVGIGGVLAEAMADVAFRLAPIDEVDAEEMLADLRGQRVLGEWRGEPALDRAATVRTLTALSTIAATRPEVVSIDVNPLMIVDGTPIAVDALVELA